VSWSFALSYPEEAVDVEAFVVEPDGSAMYFVEKVDAAQARVFRAGAPFDDGQTTVLEELTTFDSPGVAVEKGRMITGADLHPSGRQLVIRAYTGSWEYRFADGQGVADLADIAPVVVTFGPFSEPQGEAISYDASGYGLWTVSEDPEQAAPQPLHFYDCE
jgi:hypothetical protein